MSKECCAWKCELLAYNEENVINNSVSFNAYPNHYLGIVK